MKWYSDSMMPKQTKTEPMPGRTLCFTPFRSVSVLCVGWPSAEEARRGMLLRSFRTVLHELIRTEPEDGSCFEKFFLQTQIVQPDFFFPLFTGRRKLWYDKASEDQVRPGFRAESVDAKEKDHDQAL